MLLANTSSPARSYCSCCSSKKPVTSFRTWLNGAPYATCMDCGNARRREPLQEMSGNARSLTNRTVNTVEPDLQGGGAVLLRLSLIYTSFPPAPRESATAMTLVIEPDTLEYHLLDVGRVPRRLGAPNTSPATLPSIFETHVANKMLHQLNMYLCRHPVVSVPSSSYIFLYGVKF